MQIERISNVAGLSSSPGPSVLIVEDEFVIRMMLADHLLEAGWKVLEAANGTEAIEILKTGVRIDLVLSDYVMPGERSGLDVLAFVREHRASLQVVLCSGTLSPSTAIEHGAADFIAKPFTLTTIDSVCKKVLGLTDKPNEGVVHSVLVVDSDVAVRLALTDYLRECGHDVVEAADTEEARAAFTETERNFDIVLCSVTVSGPLNGFELAKWTRANKPGVQVVLAGSVERAASAAVDICDEGPHLQRPYDHQGVADYIKKLRAALDRHPGG